MTGFLGSPGFIGPPGVPGPKGATGVVGPVGPVGPAAAIGLSDTDLSQYCAQLNCDEQCEVDVVDRPPTAWCLCTIQNSVVRVMDGVQCNTLNECNYENGGCEQNCFKLTNGTFYCGCRPGFTLSADGQSCETAVTLLTVGGPVSAVTVDCAANNGDCEQICVPGNNTSIGHCACKTGYYVAAYGLLCADVNECNRTTPACPAGNNCINTEGSFYCMSAANSTSVQTAASDPSSEALVAANGDLSANTSAQLNDIENALQPINSQASTINIIFYSLLVWIAVVTVILLVVIVATYKHWRRDRSRNVLDTSSIRSRSDSQAASMADVETERKKLPPTTNGGFVVDADSAPGQLFTSAVVHSKVSNRPAPASGLSTVASLDETGSVFRAPLRLT